MRFIVVDDEELALKFLIKKIREVYKEDEIHGFSDPMEALEFVKSNKVDIVFLDIEMYGINGIELAKEIKDIYHNIRIIFITGFPQYAIEAFQLHASGYLLKPPTTESIKREIEFAVNSIIKTQSNSKIRIQTFGGFEVFVDDIPIQFSRAKSKELLAYLVDKKGAGATTAEMASVLWEDREYNRATKNYFQTIVSDMFLALKTVNVEDIVIKKRNNMSIDTTKFECDYYKFLKGDVQAINSYSGDYMISYSWGEFTMGFLENNYNK